MCADARNEMADGPHDRSLMSVRMAKAIAAAAAATRDLGSSGGAWPGVTSCGWTDLSSRRTSVNSASRATVPPVARVGHLPLKNGVPSLHVSDGGSTGPMFRSFASHGEEVAVMSSDGVARLRRQGDRELIALPGWVLPRPEHPRGRPLREAQQENQGRRDIDGDGGDVTRRAHGETWRSIRRIRPTCRDGDAFVVERRRTTPRHHEI